LAWLGLVALVLAWAGIATAQEPPKPRTDKPKTMRFEMRQQAWEQVLETLSDATGLPVSASGPKPQGTVTHYSPKDKEYTIGEVLDFLNDGLMTQKAPGPFILIRRPEKLILLHADDPQSLDINLLTRITVDDLQLDEPPSKQKYGRTELAIIVFQLQSMTGEEATRDLTPLKGPFGKITPIAKGNRLQVLDNVGNLRRMKKHLEENDSPERVPPLEIINLGGIDGPSVLNTLQKQWGIVPGGQRPVGARISWIWTLPTIAC